MLNEDWNKWVATNLENRCSLLSIYTHMVQSGLREDEALSSLTKELQKVKYNQLGYAAHSKNKIIIYKDVNQEKTTEIDKYVSGYVNTGNYQPYGTNNVKPKVSPYAGQNLRNELMEAVLTNMPKANMNKDIAMAINKENESENKVGEIERNVSIVFKCTSPEVVVYDSFLSDDECDALIEFAKTRMEASKVISNDDGSSIFNEGRTSQNAFFQRGESELIRTIENRISKLLNIPVDHGEGLQVLNYGVGKQYKPHYDYFDSQTGGAKHIVNGGQRIGTFIMYLNDVEAGGTTSFPEMNMTVYPKKGNALFFSYTNNQFQCDDRSLHSGDPVIEGSKWISTKWLREKVIVY